VCVCDKYFSPFEMALSFLFTVDESGHESVGKVLTLLADKYNPVGAITVEGKLGGVKSVECYLNTKTQ